MKHTHSTDSTAERAWIKLAAKTGYAAKGGIYLIIGGLATAAAFGAGTGTTGSDGALVTIVNQQEGKILLGIVGATIIASAFFQFYRAYEKKFCDRMDYGEVDSNARRWLIRLGQSGLSARGIVFLVVGGFLILAAVQADPGNAKGLGEALSTLESQPYGPWILATVGLGLICYAAHQFVKGRYRRIG